jgi:chaperonin cofactor prefoldin
MKDSTGALAWIKPDTNTVEGIQTTVTELKGSVETLDGEVDAVVEDVTALEERAEAVEQNLAALEAEVGNPAEGETPASGLYAELEVIEEELGLKANAADVYTKEEADGKFETIGNVALKADKTYVDEELAKKANSADVYTKTEVEGLIANAEHLKRKFVDALPAIEEADAHTIYMVPKEGGKDPDVRDEFMVVDGAWEKIGDTAVNLEGYATESYVTEAIKNKAEVGASYTKAEADNLLNAKANVADVENLLNGKVDKDENARLMAIAEGTKLAGIAEGAEVNVINAVSEDFTIGENRTLVLNNISASKIVDLETLLNNKANKADVEALDKRVGDLEGYMTWTEMVEPTR